jgi:hypothetical protein
MKVFYDMFIYFIIIFSITRNLIKRIEDRKCNALVDERNQNEKDDKTNND